MMKKCHQMDISDQNKYNNSLFKKFLKIWFKKKSEFGPPWGVALKKKFFWNSIWVLSGVGLAGIDMSHTVLIFFQNFSMADGGYEGALEG